jgi:DeoR/GlpR family transcriptional regulator of sugar metabolism
MNTMLDTPIWQLTPRQLFELQEEWAKRMPQQREEKKLFTVEEVAQKFNKSKATIYRYLEKQPSAKRQIGNTIFVVIENLLQTPTAKTYKKTKRSFTL